MTETAPHAARPPPAVAGLPPRRTLRLPWPLPAVLAWSAGWAVWWLLVSRAPPAWALLAGLAVSLAVAARIAGWRRRLIAAAGFPLSVMLSGLAAQAPGWWWLLPLAVGLAAYPPRAWRDAPFYPTAPGALEGLARIVGEPRRVLDAGCGAGHGLAELRRLWPQARIEGIECSAALAALAALRGRVAGLRATVRRADMWRHPWQGFDLVYVFQRPESMSRTWSKACEQLAPGAWLVSLDFAVPGVTPHARLDGDGRRTVWIYRVSPRASDSTGHEAGR